ncbi:NAD(P)/FAD-dependent oxidoreductase [Selenihalanaerobacter shriftii]|uniref:Thioredoxin reductase (NADPH) n=1 Tax=Selenihalanaerobacter shriftii TaxID=142842 RepID=A0A1T4P7I0_9FIRM|nr:NAD(P)/FAD-dependent oxidoreductase [Selenihalanaerobacter shriftii]SJZ86858.1 thioredoxin reductase (NADPH) [Selenihalanaerobacter shriftii]
MVEDKKFEVAVIGGGPAGMSAAVNVKIRNKDVVIFESQELGGKILTAPHVDNYLGFYDVNGRELVNNFVAHINKLEVEVIEEKIVQIYSMGDYFALTTNQESYKAEKIILATGVNNQAQIDGEADFLGKGVSYCATCDGQLFRDKEVVVIGYSEKSIEEVNYLSELATTYFIPQYDGEFVELNSEVEVIKDKPQEIKGDNLVNELILENNSLEVEGIFILRPTVPTDEIISGLELEGNFIKINEKFETNFEGVYAAGDCVGAPLQVAKAIGDGQVAALNSVKK